MFLTSTYKKKKILVCNAGKIFCNILKLQSVQVTCFLCKLQSSFIHSLHKCIADIFINSSYESILGEMPSCVSTL